MKGLPRRLDRFMVAERVMEEADQIKSWVGESDFSKHFPVLLQIEKDDKKPPSPFKIKL
jgi:hypothetical protein